MEQSHGRVGDKAEHMRPRGKGRGELGDNLVPNSLDAVVESWRVPPEQQPLLDRIDAIADSRIFVGTEGQGENCRGAVLGPPHRHATGHVTAEAEHGSGSEAHRLMSIPRCWHRACLDKRSG